MFQALSFPQVKNVLFHLMSGHYLQVILLQISLQNMHNIIYEFALKHSFQNMHYYLRILAIFEDQVFFSKD